MKTTIALLPLATLASASIARRANCSITCTPSTGAAHIIVSRASTEAAGPGILGYIADDVIEQCPGSDLDSNPYPALLSPYIDSETQGLGNLTEMVTEYISCCPDSQIVLLGYSQGAQVTADFLCGRNETGFNSTPAYAGEVVDNLSAVVLMGDPSFVKGLPWDRGNASNVSYFPRLDNTPCDPVADVLISYCDSGDYYCDSGNGTNAIAIHEGYVPEYGADAVQYIVDQIGDCAASSS